MNRLLTVNEASEYLGLSQTKVRAILPRLGAVDLSRGEGKQRCIRIPWDGIRSYLDECRIRQPIASYDFTVSRRRA